MFGTAGAVTTSASGLVVKSNVAIVGPRVRFSAGAFPFVHALPFNPLSAHSFANRLTRWHPGFAEQIMDFGFSGFRLV